MRSIAFLKFYKFVVFKFQPVAHIDSKGKQCNRNLRNYTGVIIFYIGVITADIRNRAVHIDSLKRPAPNYRGG